MRATISVKWGKLVWDEMVIDTKEPVTVLKAQLYKLTSVPVERQKLVSTAWKGFLREDADLSQLTELVDGARIVIIGSVAIVNMPMMEPTISIEDTQPKDMVVSGMKCPAGLVNPDHTCYMNSILQSLRPVVEFRLALKQYKDGDTSDSLADAFTASLRDMYEQLDENVESILPMRFISVLRDGFPQFAQQSRSGEMIQQDSDEFLTTLWSTVSCTLTSAVGSESMGPAGNVVDALFGLEMSEVLECVETNQEAPVTRSEKALKLVCNITARTNDMCEGIRTRLADTIEKRSEVLGCNATWRTTRRIRRLPKYLCVQFMRFCWKPTPSSRDHVGVKCKVLRQVNFPEILDISEFCTEELQATMKLSRIKGGSTDKDIAGSPGVGLPANFQGYYELYAIVTHRGRSAESGHYMAWVRDNGDDWFAYNDDDVSSCKTNDVLQLTGGSVWHMAYLAFYRAKR